jgi:hypothetical protein
MLIYLVVVSFIINFQLFFNYFVENRSLVLFAISQIGTFSFPSTLRYFHFISLNSTFTFSTAFPI